MGPGRQEGAGGGLAAETLLNHLVGPDEDGLGERDSQGLGRFQIDRQLEARGLLNREVGGLRALEDLVHVDGGAPEFLLWNSALRSEAIGPREMEVAARTLGVKLSSLGPRRPPEYDAALAAATKERAGAIIFIGSSNVYGSKDTPLWKYVDRNPIRGSFAGCAASTAAGTATRLAAKSRRDKHERPRRPPAWPTRASETCFGSGARGISASPEGPTVR
jgi:hypothetical protein